MKNFSVKMNGLPNTAYGLGLGDLYVSVAGGRNSLMGYLGKEKIYRYKKI